LDAYTGFGCSADLRADIMGKGVLRTSQDYISEFTERTGYTSFDSRAKTRRPQLARGEYAPPTQLRQSVEPAY
jgi:hypothetical protein